MRKNIASGYNSDISVQPSAKKSKSSKQARLKRMMNLTQQQHVLPATARNKLTFVICILIKKQEFNSPCWSNRGEELVCIFCCTENHFPRDCKKVSDVSRRFDILTQKKLCFNCLGKCRTSDCKSCNRCRNCQKKRHTSIWN